MPINLKSNQFFPARVIAAASGVCPKTAQRRAQRKGWPFRQRGNRFVFEVPRRLRRKCQALSPLPRIFDQAHTIRELFRAAVVLGFVLEMERNPRRGVERTLQIAVNNFKHLKKFSTGALHGWIKGVERGGLAALCERKIGVVGRKPARLERILR